MECEHEWVIQSGLSRSCVRCWEFQGFVQSSSLFTFTPGRWVVWVKGDKALIRDPNDPKVLATLGV